MRVEERNSETCFLFSLTLLPKTQGCANCPPLNLLQHHSSRKPTAQPSSHLKMLLAPSVPISHLTYSYSDTAPNMKSGKAAYSKARNRFYFSVFTSRTKKTCYFKTVHPVWEQASTRLSSIFLSLWPIGNI